MENEMFDCCILLMIVVGLFGFGVFCWLRGMFVEVGEKVVEKFEIIKIEVEWCVQFMLQ